MKFNLKLAALAATFLTVFSIQTSFAIDLAQFQKEVESTGATGWIHGSDAADGLFVFTYRNPNNFFDYVEASLVSEDPAVMAELATFNRQDQVTVQGKFLKNPSPQIHIMVSTIAIVQKYKNPYPVDPYGHTGTIPAELQKMNTAPFLVHAIAGNGQVLVVEYKDVIVPIFVKNGDLAKNLFRGDLVQLKYKMQTYPDQPAHLNLDETDASCIQVLDSLQAVNGKPASLTGALILFPKSPEIKFNVFAVQQLLPSGYNRQFTIVNMEDMDVFMAVLAKLQAAWDRHPNEFTNGRNKLVSNHIQVTVTGTMNEVDPSQANPQLLIKTADDVVISEPAAVPPAPGLSTVDALHQPAIPFARKEWSFVQKLISLN